jgi:hypothetical protein
MRSQIQYRHVATTLAFSLIMALLRVIPSYAAQEEIVRLCGCPESSACPDNCGFYALGECQPLYQCFLEANGIFGYTKPERAADGDILVHMYHDADCETKKFDTETNGFKGACDSECWSTTSNIGAQFCGMLDGPDDKPSLTADEQENGIVQMCACLDSACPGNCELFRMNVCQPFFQCLQEPNGLFGFVRPELQPDGEVLMPIYDDMDCETERFSEVDLIAKGWKGSCQAGCWGHISKVGAVGCGIIVDDDEVDNIIPSQDTNGDDDGDSNDASNAEKFCVAYGGSWVLTLFLATFESLKMLLV